MYRKNYKRLLDLIVEDPQKKAKHISHGQAELSRKNYTIEDAKKMNQIELINLLTRRGDKKEGTDEQLPSGANKLFRTIGVPQPTIWNHLSYRYKIPLFSLLAVNPLG